MQDISKFRGTTQCYSEVKYLFWGEFCRVPGSRSSFLRFFLLVATLLFQTGTSALAHSQHLSKIYATPVPEGMHSASFTVKVNGQPVDVARAASSYDFVSFDTRGPVEVEITANEAGFWD